MGNYKIARQREPRVTVIGGGTGLSTMLRGLKNYTSDLTAIVSVADNGGGSGVLRSELGMPPPGDIRNCIQALAAEETTMAEMLAYRFTEGSLKGQSLGNLFLAGLTGIYGSFDCAVRKLSEVLAITGRVLPVSNRGLNLIAEFENGDLVRGECEICEAKHRAASRIRKMSMEPADAAPLAESLEAIRHAELIVLGPGSLYTSVIPNLLVRGVAEAIAQSQALKVYVCNVMTQDGETEGYTAADHVKAILDCCPDRLVDICLANSRPIPAHILGRYETEDAAPVVIDQEALEALGVELVTAEIAGSDAKLARHDPDALAQSLMKLYRLRAQTRIYEQEGSPCPFQPA